MEEANQNKLDKQVKDEEEYVLLDLDNVCVQADLPANAPYVLSGLDTLNPMLTIGDHLKLIGEYQETVGTCYVFSETDGAPVEMSPGTGPSETNLIKDTRVIDPNQTASKQIKPITSLHKILRFRLATDDDL